MKRGGPFGESYDQRTTQKRPKIELSAAFKTFKLSKLWNCKSNMNEAWPRYVPPQYLLFTKKLGCQSMEGGGTSKNTPKNTIKLT